MGTRILVWMCMLVFALPYARAQNCNVGDVVCLKMLAGGFPQLAALEPDFRANHEIVASTTPGSAVKLSADGSEVGGSTAFKTLVLDNLSLKAEAKYTRTLESTVQNNQTTPLALSKIEFVPSYAVNYELKLGQFVTAYRQKKAGKNLAAAQRIQYLAERAKLYKAYAEFEKLRSAFDSAASVVTGAHGGTASAPASTTPSATTGPPATTNPPAAATAAESRAKAASCFYEMKAKAIEVLSMIGDTQSSVMTDWLNARF